MSNVENPSHYLSVAAKVEPIDALECLSFCPGCALKYAIRAGRKDGAETIDDLRKCLWYLDRMKRNGVDPVAQWDGVPVLLFFLEHTPADHVRRAWVTVNAKRSGKENLGAFFLELETVVKAMAARCAK